jgi:hypothetical protein
MTNWKMQDDTELGLVRSSALAGYWFEVASNSKTVLAVFYILLTVHLGVIVVNNQLDALFSMYLFHFSTWFEQPSAHHQENQLYQYIIWYISLWNW